MNIPSAEAALISFFFIFISHLISGQLIKKRVGSPRSKVFPLRIDPMLKGLHCPGKQKGSDKRRYCTNLAQKLNKTIFVSYKNYGYMGIK